jgi:hypothetical protein
MKRLVLIVGVSLAVAACGSAPVTSQPQGTSVATPQPSALATQPTQTLSPSTAASQPAAASLTPGGINYRVINLYRDASGAPAQVDVYVRTQGLIETAPVEMGVAYGAQTDVFAPPDPGTVVVTTAGAGDPDCVATCPHIISTSDTGFGQGNARTMIVTTDGTTEFWHDPDPASVGTTGNALAPADPSTALVHVAAADLKNADFGLRLGFQGVDGCQANRTSESILIGGNQVAVFGFDGGSADVMLYDNRDTECTGDPVGGPFKVSGADGSRTLLVLHGEPSAMEAVTLEI